MKVYEVILKEKEDPKSSGVDAGTLAAAGAVGLAGVAVAPRIRLIYLTMKRKARSNTRAGQAMLGKFPLRLRMLFKIIGIAGPLIQLYSELDYAQKEYDSGKSKVIESQEELAEYRKFAFGLFNIQVLIPAVGRALVNSAIVLRIVRVLKNAIGVAGAIPSMGATIAGIVATEAFFIWLQKFFTSENVIANKWLTGYFMGVIQSFGAVTEIPWSTLVGYYQKDGAATEKGISKVATQKNPELAKEPTKAKFEIRFIGGTPVSNEQGDLLPGIENDSRVMVYRRNEISKGNPDPLAVIQKELAALKSK